MAIIIKNITKSFTKNDNSGQLAILNDISLEISNQEFISFVGPSGCGKSTLLRIIAGLLTPESGSVEVDGVPVKKPESDRMMVFQDYVLFPWQTVEKNIAMGLKMAGKDREYIDRKVKWAIEMIGLQGFEKSYPHQLSGGMKQRVAIARALVMNPKILLMDEPFGALDSYTKMKLQSELVQIVVFTGSPARIQEIISVDLPRPRDRVSKEFIAVRDHILSLTTSGMTDHI